jgi:tetratricopeptide (TPR) repeat protein
MLAVPGFLIRRAGAEEAEGFPLRTAHYEIHGGGAAAQRIAGDLEGRFSVYTRLFRFNPRELAAPLRVRLIPDPGDYGAYLAERLGEGSPGALYLHYGQRERRELVINYGDSALSGEDAGGGSISAGPGDAGDTGSGTGGGTGDGTGDGAWERALPYQAFIQYLRSFIPQPPLWMEEGFAIYFSTLGISAAGELEYRENLSWLETVKRQSPPPGRDILLGTAREGRSRAEFSALSWSLVSFFLNSGNEDYFRSLLECFMLLSPQAGAAENSDLAARRIGDWNGFDQLDRDYRAYLDSRRTFPELVDEGRRAYEGGNFRPAEQSFLQALDLRPAHHAPYYYLALIAYDEGRWDAAEGYFAASLERGADQALVYYALGLNAAAAGQIDRAAEFLHRAAITDPARYRERVEGIIRRLPVY